MHDAPLPLTTVGLAVSGGDDVHFFIIDTDSYAGNFERDMCAYLTGQIGECEIGDDIADHVNTRDGAALAWVEDAITTLPDEHGTHRPVTIAPTPGYYNDGHGNIYRVGTGPAADDSSAHPYAYLSVAISFQRALSDDERQLLIDRARAFVADYVDRTTDADGDERYERIIETIGSKMFMAPKQPITILGFRVVTMSTSHTCTWVQAV